MSHRVDVEVAIEDRLGPAREFDLKVHLLSPSGELNDRSWDPGPLAGSGIEQVLIRCMMHILEDMSQGLG